MEYLGLCSSHLDSSCNRFWIRIPSGESQKEGGGIFENVCESVVSMWVCTPRWPGRSRVRAAV